MPVMIFMDFESNNPDIAASANERALSINAEPGFLWKIWTKDAETGRPGGIYCFDDIVHARNYIQMHQKRLSAMGAIDNQFKILNINEALTRLNHGPLE